MNNNNDNLKRENESLPIVAQNNAIKTNCVKAKIDKNNYKIVKFGYVVIDETIYHIISECCKLKSIKLDTIGWGR